MDSSNIRCVLSIRYLQNEFTLDMEVSVDASDRDHKMFGPNTIARLPDVIRFAEEWSTTCFKKKKCFYKKNIEF